MRETVNAYYYSFELTGVEPIDNILRVVARAGKAYYNTEYWGDPWDKNEEPFAERIQAAADAAAKEWATKIGKGE